MTPFKIGTKFMTRGKAPKLCTVVDVLKTYDSKGEMVSLRYVAEHDFMGQKIKGEVVGTTIAMGLIKPKFDHAFTIAFSVKTDNEGDKVTKEEYKAALIQRIADLDANDEWNEVIDLPYDSFKN